MRRVPPLVLATQQSRCECCVVLPQAGEAEQHRARILNSAPSATAGTMTQPRPEISNTSSTLKRNFIAAVLLAHTTYLLQNRLYNSSNSGQKANSSVSAKHEVSLDLWLGAMAKESASTVTVPLSIGFAIVKWRNVATPIVIPVGGTAILSEWDKRRPHLPNYPGQQGICAAMESYLQPCECGGRFRKGTFLRCPHCNKPFSAESATSYIEANAPGAKKGWRWGPLSRPLLYSRVNRNPAHT